MGVPSAPGSDNLTNFSRLTNEQKTTWSRDFWKMARNLSFMNQFAGRGSNAMIQRVTDLTKSEKGTRAVLTLLADMQSDGIVGDNILEGNEEGLRSYDTVINIDQLRNANRLEGRVADQKSIVTFRENSRDQLAYWFADRLDQMAFLALAGVGLDKTNKGADRKALPDGKKWTDLEWAADIKAPTANRHLRWSKTDGDLATGDTSALTAADTITYNSLVWAKAHAKDEYIRGIRSSGGEEVFHVFLCPKAMARLKLDPDYIANVRSAMPRSGKNPLFAGTTSVMVDGLIIHEFRHAFNTVNAASGSKWGSGNVDGCRVSLCGAQSLGFADIGTAEWNEKEFDYGNQKGISISKIFGFLRPQFHNDHTGQVEDFGVLNIDYAL
ncbi:N4-gp56 family major capsid protein [Parendozoicomonas haliclonae]|uniref:N4-gp56 family major capsid protein n=1 Tax=Parendozoicomonas haliclonae TaxID=1960125 RepID=A0A1X7AEM4_9GAMM|nr:N4-gp56 family major capsid protein [Parendozoicomonas haliclonae]SMA33340.1 hypothetical protein EHSB41UT_00264 [Parendozoicomonas haliclonae]